VEHKSSNNPWTELFGGHKLSNHNGDAVDPATFTSKAGVMIYFSAHWCPPCRGFTPQLATYHNSHKDKFNFETVFVSSDKDQTAFDEYWGEMPWLALPFSERNLKTTLSSKYKVSGIPTLVILDNQANLITTGGRGKVSTDPEGFPWVPKSFFDIIAGDVINGKNESISTDTLKSNTAIGIYFSAHWCPPCREFTPKLVSTYNTIKAAGKKFEIVFASSDNDEASFKEYFHEMPWLTLPFNDKRISALSELYEVEGIPTFVIIDPATGKNINTSGRAAVGADPQGEDFPWHPKPLNSVDMAGSVLNDQACLIYIDSNLSDETKASLNTVATTYVNKWKGEGKSIDGYPLHFYWGKSGGLDQRVKEFTSVNSDPALLIIDIPDGGKYVHSLSGHASETDFKNFVDGFLGKTLTKKGIKE